MSTMLYAPGVRILVSTARNGIIDVSDDISRGTVSLRVNQPHSLAFSLVNHRRKYDGVFTPNDRFTVQLKRLRWLHIMAGYLTQVPFFTTYPKSVALTGECTLKRIRYKVWDPGTEASVQLVNRFAVTDTLGGAELDDTFVQRAKAVLKEVAQWPVGTDGDTGIHIGRLPVAWLARVDAVAKELAPEFSVAADLIGAGATMSGIDPLTDYGTTVLKHTVNGESVPNQGEGYGSLPYLGGKVHVDSSSGTGLITSTAPSDQWWCDIRLPYLMKDQYASMNNAEKAAARAWWVDRKLLIVNPKNNNSLVLHVVGNAPLASTGRDITFSQAAADKLGVTEGSDVSIRFARYSAAAIGSDGIIVNSDTPPTNPSQPLPGLGSSLPSGPGVFGNLPTGTPSANVSGSKKGLKPIVALAFDFGAKNFPGVLSILGVGPGSVKGSDHPLGLALDYMLTTDGHAATGQALSDGNAIAAWFAGNPNAFGVKYIIWRDRINSGAGWRPYVHDSLKGKSATQIASAASDNLQHRNHVHVSFRAPGTSTVMGPMGSAWPGSAPGDFAGGFTGVTAGSTSPLNASEWFAQSGNDPESTSLTGIRALMNDVPLEPYITMLMTTSMRQYCSAPNGDFIGWFPDYFGVYGTAGKMRIRNIELQDFSMVWSDENLKTHIFTSGSITGYGSADMAEEVVMEKVQTSGIATVEFPSLLRALLNVDPNPTAESQGWLDPKTILQRFGARPEYYPMGALTSRKAEFWYALQLFQENWSNQFTAQAPITFMPELFPGMLMVLADYGIQFYVNGVDHEFDFENGGGFTTSVYIKAPSTTDGRGLFGLPKGGRI